MWFKQAFHDKVVIIRCLAQYWQIFFLFLIFCCYFTRLKACEISCKIWETRKIFSILYSAPCDNNYIYDDTRVIRANGNILTFYRSNHRRCSVKKSAYKNFAKFTGKDLCWILLAFWTATLLKRDSNTDVFQSNLRTF